MKDKLTSAIGISILLLGLFLHGSISRFDASEINNLATVTLRIEGMT